MAVNFKALETWYMKRPDVAFEIIKFLYNREFALIVPSWVTDKALHHRSTRTLRAHNVQSFQYLLGAGLRMFRGLGQYQEISTPYNFYASLARYQNGIPLQKLNFSERDNSEWKEKHLGQMTSFDFLIDIDAGEHSDMEYAQYSANGIIDYFDREDVPYELRFSGKGFHIIVPFEHFGLNHSVFTDEKNSIFRTYAKIAKCLRKDYSDMIDMGIYDSRRVCKLPYTWALYEDTAYLCVPFLSKAGFMEFKLDDYRFLDKLETAPQCFNIRGRGTKVFNSSGSATPLLEMV